MSKKHRLQQTTESNIDSKTLENHLQNFRIKTKSLKIKQFSPKFTWFISLKIQKNYSVSPFFWKCENVGKSKLKYIANTFLKDR